LGIKFTFAPLLREEENRLNNEKNISTIQKKASEQARLPFAHEQQEWPQGVGSP
jgi:hypothetical protein